MKRQAAASVALGAVGLAVGVVGVLALREATLSTHQPVAAATRDRRSWCRARTTGGERSQTLPRWSRPSCSTCRLEVDLRPRRRPVEPLGDGRFRAVLSPSLDETNRRQFRAASRTAGVYRPCGASTRTHRPSSSTSTARRAPAAADALAGARPTGSAMSGGPAGTGTVRSLLRRVRLAALRQGRRATRGAPWGFRPAHMARRRCCRPRPGWPPPRARVTTPPSPRPSTSTWTAAATSPSTPPATTTAPPRWRPARATTPTPGTRPHARRRGRVHAGRLGRRLRRPRPGLTGDEVVAELAGADRDVYRRHILGGVLTHSLGPDPWTPMSDAAACDGAGRRAERAAGGRHRRLPDRGRRRGRRLHPGRHYYAGLGVHYQNWGLLSAEFDPARPVQLLYDGTAPDAHLVGVSYVVSADPDTPPEGFTGENDRGTGTARSASTSPRRREPELRRAQPRPSAPRWAGPTCQRGRLDAPHLGGPGLRERLGRVLGRTPGCPTSRGRHARHRLQ